jgi:hypothetical protein
MYVQAALPPGSFGPAGPAQAGERGIGRGFQPQAAVGLAGVEIVGLLGFRRGIDRQHAAQHLVRAIRRDAFEPRVPRFEIQILEVLVRIVLGDVHRFADRGIDVRRDGSDHAHVIARGDVHRGHEMRRQVRHVAAEVLVQAPGVVFDVVRLVRVVRHALLALIGPRVRRLYAVRCVIGEGERDRAGRGDGQQVAVAYAVFADVGLDVLRQA